jgi:hypothetical protein
MIGTNASLVGFSLPLGVVWGFVTNMGGGGGGVHILLWGLLGSRWYWGTWSIFRLFHPFEFKKLREMVGIMSILTAKGTREVCSKSVVILPLAFFVISPLGVLVPLVLVAPGWLVLLGVVLVPSWS